jgi:hypothetical protein
MEMLSGRSQHFAVRGDRDVVVQSATSGAGPTQRAHVYNNGKTSGTRKITFEPQIKFEGNREELIAINVPIVAHMCSEKALLVISLSLGP